jgi:hypothetical protein
MARRAIRAASSGAIRVWTSYAHVRATRAGTPEAAPLAKSPTQQAATVLFQRLEEGQGTSSITRRRRFRGPGGWDDCFAPSNP